MTIFGPIVFSAERAFAVSIILGLAVRWWSWLAIAYGCCNSGSASMGKSVPEWPWTYMFLAMLRFLFCDRGWPPPLRIDAWLRPQSPRRCATDGGLSLVLHIAG